MLSAYARGESLVAQVGVPATRRSRMDCVPTNPNVTVVIPTYNRCRYLAEALDSVTAQTYPHLQIYISDNGSTDGTPDRLRELAGEDPRVSIHCFPQNLGIVRNWQQALSDQRTEYVALLNDDDLWLPDHLATGIAALDATPDAALYFCLTESFGASAGNLYVHNLFREYTTRTVLDTRADVLPILRGIHALPSAMIFRSSALKGLFYPESPMLGAVDWLVNGQAAMRGSTIYDPVVRAKYRLHTSNISACTCNSKQGGVMCRYVFRKLAEIALERGQLDCARLVRVVSEEWPVDEASTMVVALAVYDAPAPLRQAAYAVAHNRQDLWSGPQVSRHCLAAAKVGQWYLTLADAADRVDTGWWPPAG